LGLAALDALIRTTFRQQFSISIARIVRAALLVVILSMALGELISLLSQMWSLEKWLGALVLHACLAVAYLTWCQSAKSGESEAVRRPAIVSDSLLYLPSVAVVIGALVASALTRVFLSNGSSVDFAQLNFFDFCAVALIPAVEEIIYRRGFGGFFRKMLGPVWGWYFAVVFFSVVHSDTTLDGWIHGRVGVALGPLFLAVATQFLFFTFGRLGPVIALHMACNASAVIFKVIDDRWLGWLEQLYT
jgi:membrane protease YdiL (CAAX protease family)